MSRRLTVATYNIHKGLSPLNRRLIIHDVRERLHALDADIVFLQEVQGMHARRARRFDDWPEAMQHEHIAEGRYVEAVYGANARHRHGEHGNAILSAFPIAAWTNRDVSHHRFEHRGHLLARVALDDAGKTLTCCCIHLGLFHRSRAMQVERLIHFLRESTGEDDPIVVAGDFNDWRAGRSGLCRRLHDELGLIEAFTTLGGRPARTFPAALPMLTLDRIYVRGFAIESAKRLMEDADGSSWRLSDHVGLVATLRLL